MKKIILFSGILAVIGFIAFELYLKNNENQRQSVPAPQPGSSAALLKNFPLSATSDAAAVKESAADADKKSNIITTKDGMLIETLKIGNGTEVKNGDKVTAHYTGTLEDGTKFDSSLDRDTPFSFTLGAGQVIKGWDIGILGMKVGEKRKLTIPSNLAYGPNGIPGVIPPNATLFFEVELVGVNQ